MLKLLCSTILEKIITNGAIIWWKGNLTKVALNKLVFVHRMFLLRISRGYRTISNDALNILTSIPPIYLTIKYQLTESNILYLEN